MQFQDKIGKFMLILPENWLCLKMRAKHANICNFYVKSDTKVEKRGHWVWTEEKNGYPSTYGSASPRGLNAFKAIPS